MYAARLDPDHVDFFVDHQLVRTVGQSPAYPMQLMLEIYELPGDGGGDYPKEFTVDSVRGCRPARPI